MDHDDTTTGTGLLGIGEISRATGLSVSALRFYDRQGVLVPADVDGVTGYRRYSRDQVRSGRLLAGMRRIQMPVPEMVAVLESLQDGAVAQDLLAGHLTRLEHGLADARREVARLQDLVLGEVGGPRGVIVDAAALAGALEAVRYAVCSDPDFPVLSAVLLDRDADGVRLVATDRYRLAVAVVPGAVGGPNLQLPVPRDLVDELAGTPVEGPVTVSRADGRVRAAGAGWSGESSVPDGDYPDFRRLLHPGAEHTALLPVEEVRSALADHEHHHIPLSPEGAVAGPGSLLLDREFLWDAVSRVSDGHVVLPLGGTIGPLLVRSGDESVLSLVMPVRPEPHR